LQPVFQAILSNATRICDAQFGTLFLYKEAQFHPGAMVSAPPEYADFHRKRGAFSPVTGNPLDRLVRTKKLVHVADSVGEDSTVSRLGGARTHIAVPMLKDGGLMGAIVIYRQEVRQFTEKQTELVQNFAAQAVIAIENTRLLNELRESLQQQTATADVLKIISSSPGQLAPVFSSMLENATRICGAGFGSMFHFDGKRFDFAANYGTPPALVELQMQRGPFLPPPGGVLERVMRTKQVAHSADYAAEQPQAPPVALGGARSTVAVPMLKDNQLVGGIVIYRKEVRPFSEKEIDLVKNFASQAVIAIENTRLLNDLNKLNQQLEQRVTDQVSEIERMGKLRRFLPAQVADLIVASGAEKQLESHRREITALFCDLRGFTGFSESSDPEDVMALLHEYHAAIGGIINKYGGTLERYAGDGVMVVFNDPIPVDNPALQAVRMAIDMRAAIGELIEKWRKLGHDIGFGIGIAHGFATLGTIGFEGRFDYAAIGTVSNVASRLCDEAKPGQILISPRVLMAVEKDITVEPVGEFALKGIRRPLTAHNVLATKAAD
jgi:class 3 adenylate cyclase/putative methionine-R-sulfoxide reductase with GAF domain